MKSKLSMGGGILLFLLLVCNVAISQTEDFECATDDVLIPDIEGLYSYATNSENPSQVLPFNVPLVLNVYYWQVNNPNGEFNPSNNPNQVLNENRVLESVAYLNKKYNEFNIYFKYLGFGVIPETPADLPYRVWELNPNTNTNQCIDYPGFDPHGYGIVGRCQITQFFDWVAENYYNPNAINIYVPYGTQGYSGAANGHLSTRSVLSASRLTNYVLTHEVGHNLNIRHTRSNIERVTRDPEMSYFNATTAGDQVVDTNAQRPFRKSTLFNDSHFHYVYLDICEYAPLGIDPDNNPLPKEQDNVGYYYTIENYDITNAMSDCWPCQNDDSKLTMGQGIRARETIFNNSGVGQTFEGAITTVASLYEPYKGEYYIAGPSPEPSNPPLFQPGFKYRFFECECDCPDGEPTPYEDVSFSFSHNVLLSIEKDETDYTSITHPNHSAIHIVFDNPFPDSYGQWTRKCYDNWNRAPIGGSVTKFNDNIFNTNVTITPKNSEGINDPNLINQLEPGLYKIDKIYEDGAVKQDVILKGDN